MSCVTVLAWFIFLHSHLRIGNVSYSVTEQRLSQSGHWGVGCSGTWYPVSGPRLTVPLEDWEPCIKWHIVTSWKTKIIILLHFWCCPKILHY